MARAQLPTHTGVLQSALLQPLAQEYSPGAVHTPLEEEHALGQTGREHATPS